jgi:hypothetical protein
VAHWLQKGRLRPENLRRALVMGGVLPTAGDWRRFLDRLLLWLGTVGVASGVIFFLAYNWERLGRFAKLGLVESLVVAALVFVGRLGLDRCHGALRRHRSGDQNGPMAPPVLSARIRALTF